MSELGQLLKNKREELNKTVATVSHDTKITEKLINIMEAGNFKSLPSYLHAFGFVKKYSEYLGYKYEDEIKPLFDVEYPKDPEIVLKSDINVGLSEHEKQRSNTRTMLIVVILIVLVGAGYTVYNMMYSKKPIQETQVVPEIEVPMAVAPEIPEVMEETQRDDLVSLSEIIDVSNGDNTSDDVADNITEEAAVVEETVVMEPSEDLIEFTNATRNDVVLSFSEECWLQFVADNNTIEFTANGGTVRTLSFQGEFEIFVGNAAALTITYGEQVITNIGEPGKVRRITYALNNGELAAVE